MEEDSVDGGKEGMGKRRREEDAKGDGEWGNLGGLVDVGVELLVQVLLTLLGLLRPPTATATTATASSRASTAPAASASAPWSASLGGLSGLGDGGGGSRGLSADHLDLHRPSIQGDVVVLLLSSDGVPAALEDNVGSAQGSSRRVVVNPRPFQGTEFTEQLVDVGV